MKYVEQQNLTQKNPSNDVQMSKEFKEYLTHLSIDEKEKHNIRYLLNFFRYPQDPLITSRSFIFYGSPGVGKTFFAEQLIYEMNQETLYLSCKPLNQKKMIRCHSIEDILTKLKPAKNQVIFLDDLKYLLTSNEYGEFQSEEKKQMMILLEEIKQQPNKILLVTMNHLHRLDPQLIDRFEVLIYVDIPDSFQKQQYLKNHYRKYLTKDLQRFIAANSIGYNYRDLPEMVKLAYRLGNHQISKASLKNALTMCYPSQLQGFEVENGLSESFNDIIGKKKPLQVIQRLVTQYQQQDLCNTLGLKRNNILLFHGPPGTGKSFMARALAGEIQFPLIQVSALHLHGQDPFHGIHKVIGMAKRYQRCIIFVDEAEKMLGNDSYSDDNPILGELHRCLDGGDGGRIQSILVFAINDLRRFGMTLLDRFTLVPFELPSFEERREYFKKKIELAQQHAQVNFSHKHLALQTEKMSFREMDRFWNDLMYTQLEGGKEQLGRGYPSRIYRDQGEIMYG